MKALRKINRCLFDNFIYRAQSIYVKGHVNKRSSSKMARRAMKLTKEESDYYMLPNSMPIASLKCEEAFAGLSNKEKLYAHHIARAGWYGSFITSIQISSESPLLMMMLVKLFQTENIESLRKLSIEKCGFTEEEFKAFVVYAAGVLCFHGNYKSFGDTKIIPNVDKDKLESLLKATSAWKDSNLEFLWDSCSDAAFSLSEREKQLGLLPKGTTTYFSSNCSESDAQIVNKFLEKENISPYNTRTIKTVKDGKSCYEIRTASIEEGAEDCKEFEGCHFYVTRGDYQPLLLLVCDELEKAKEYASNQLENDMLTHYVKSFRTGSIPEHKDGSRCWVKNQKPAVETYVGFIETYTDPSGVRGEFECFAAVVNKERSRVFEHLVSEAEAILPKLPWPATHEKDHFLRPDFTALDVVGFAGGMPAGINIPNYDDIRQNEGFKNVSLNNSIQAALTQKTINFVNKDDEELIIKHIIKVFEMQVGLHELLGHGSGKLFMRNKDGTFNFNKDSVKDPLTSELINSWYEEGETYDTRFGNVGSAYEECRAECVGLYLCLFDEVIGIFEKELKEVYQYVNFITMVLSGFGKALEMYRPESKSWLQAHCHARHVILRVLLEHGDGVVNIKECVGEDGKPDLRVTVDKTKIKTSGKAALGEFLVKLQAYKSSGNVSEASKLFNYYGNVSDDGDYPFLKWRQIALARRKHRNLVVQPNTFIDGDSVYLKEYSADTEGMIESWVDRYKGDKLDGIIIDLWKKDAKHFVQ